MFWPASFILMAIAASQSGWRNQVALGFVWCGLVAISTLKSYDISLRIALAVLLAQVAFFSMQLESPYPQQDPNLPTIMDSVILHSAVMIAIAVSAAHFFVSNGVRAAHFITGLCFLALIASAKVLFSPLIGLPATAFMNSDSMDATLLAILYPVLLYVFLDDGFTLRHQVLKYFALGLPIAAIIQTGSVMGIVCLGTAIVAYFPKMSGRGLSAVVRFVIVALVGGFALSVFISHTGRASIAGAFNGRLDIWAGALQFWKENVNPLTGAGLSSFNHFGRVIQDMYGIDNLRPNANWVFMHSDWLQTLFDTGIIGLSAAITLAIRALTIAWREGRQIPFSCMAVVCVASIGQMPFRYFVSGFISIFIVMMCVKTKPEWGTDNAQVHS